MTLSPQELVDQFYFAASRVAFLATYDLEVADRVNEACVLTIRALKDNESFQRKLSDDFHTHGPVGEKSIDLPNLPLPEDQYLTTAEEQKLQSIIKDLNTEPEFMT